MSTQNIYDLTDTWNNVATTFTAIKMNATDTASAAGSLLIDLQVGGSSKFSVRKDGVLITGSVALSSVTGLGANVATALAVAVGFAGAVVTNGGALGTPSSGTLTNATGLPVGGITGLGTGVATFLATPSSANLLAALTTKTGTGNNVFADGATLTTPTLGVATATSINKVALTAPATAATLTILNNKTFTVNNTLTLAGTDGSTLTIGTGGTLGTAAYINTGSANTWAGQQTFSAGPVIQVTTSGALTAIGNAINTTNKAQGKIVFAADVGKIVCAAGAAAGDYWYGDAVYVPV